MVKKQSIKSAAGPVGKDFIPRATSVKKPNYAPVNGKKMKIRQVKVKNRY
jgi:hypothetical protein